MVKRVLVLLAGLAGVLALAKRRKAAQEGRNLWQEATKPTDQR